jgi:hypothetical protein
MNKIKKIYKSIKNRAESYLKRRPHRSFRRTRRRDYGRTLTLPGYFAFNKLVRKTLWQNRNIFLLLALTYAVLMTVMVGFASQDLYLTLKDTLNATSGNYLDGVWGEASKVGLLFITTVTGGLSQNLTEVQQVYAIIIALLTWLTTVWLLRNIMAGHRVKLRDGLYSAGSPILPTFIIFLLLIFQMLPLALAIIGYSAASMTGVLNGGVETMLFWVAAGLLATVSLYFMSSTFFALIIVTIPGMYPYRAIKAAGDLVVGRRMRILLRLIWMAFGVATTWLVIMVLMILFDSWIKDMLPAINWAPLIPFTLLSLSSLTIVWVSSYIYLLYRKVVDDESESA